MANDNPMNIFRANLDGVVQVLRENRHRPIASFTINAESMHSISGNANLNYTGFELNRFDEFVTALTARHHVESLEFQNLPFDRIDNYDNWKDRLFKQFVKSHASLRTLRFVGCDMDPELVKSVTAAIEQRTEANKLSLVFEDTPLDDASVGHVAVMVRQNSCVSLLGFLHCARVSHNAQLSIFNLRNVILALENNTQTTSLIIDIRSTCEDANPLPQWDDNMTRALARSAVATLTLRLPTGWNLQSIETFASGLFPGRDDYSQYTHLVTVNVGHRQLEELKNSGHLGGYAGHVKFYSQTPQTTFPVRQSRRRNRL